MRKIIKILTMGLLFLAVKVQAQNSFTDVVTIGQSMATSKQQALPAQISATFPANKPASLLINTGISVDTKFLSTDRLLSALTVEFHRNTLTDSAQNSFQVGYKGILFLGTGKGGNTDWSFTFDPQFNDDRVAKKHSIQSNLLLSWHTTGTSFNWGDANVNQKKTHYTKFSLIPGTQVAQVFPSDTNANLRGTKIRPLVIGDAGLFFIRNRDVANVVVGIDVSYTQRIAAVNTTADGERYTHLFKASANYFIVNKPAKVSIGALYQDGADKYTGLKQQKYFLIALNVFLSK